MNRQQICRLQSLHRVWSTFATEAEFEIEIKLQNCVRLRLRLRLQFRFQFKLQFLLRLRHRLQLQSQFQFQRQGFGFCFGFCFCIAPLCLRRCLHYGHCLCYCCCFSATFQGRQMLLCRDLRYDYCLTVDSLRLPSSANAAATRGVCVGFSVLEYIYWYSMYFLEKTE